MIKVLVTLLLITWQVFKREVSFQICSNVKLVHMVYQFEFSSKVSLITQLNLIWLGNQIIELDEGFSPSNCIGMDMFLVHMTINVVRSFSLNQFLNFFKLFMVKLFVEFCSKLHYSLIEGVFIILVKVIIYY